MSARVSSPLSADVLAAARRSIVAVSAGGTGGTGWIALGNGIVVTSWRAVAFQAEVGLSSDDGRRAQGRVVFVDAERDLAFVLPTDSLNAPPLPMRVEPLPRLGEPVTTLFVSPNEPLVALVAIVSAESHKAELAALEPDPAPRTGRGGAPALDEQGRVIGVISAGRRGPRTTPLERRLLPVGVFSRELRALDLPAAELAERAPIHRCPSCTEPFSAENDRCHACGVLLPHAFEAPRSALGAERVVRDALASLGIVANKARVGPTTWRISHRALGGDAQPTEVTVRIDELGLQVILRVPLVRLPGANHEHFYRLLLTTNDQTAGVFRLSLAGDVVVLSFAEPVSAFASEHDVAVVFHDLVRQADQLRKLFAELYGAEPLREGSI